MDEESPLIIGQQKTPPCSKYINSSCIPYKGAVLVLIWSALLHSSGSFLLTGIMVLRIQDKFHDASIDRDIQRFAIVIIAMIFTLLLYPLMGLIAEVWLTRIKFMILGTILVLIGLLIHMSDYFTDRCFRVSTNEITDCLNNAKNQITIPLILGLIIVHIGLGAFNSNVIQFGTDQLQFANTDELSKFVHWYFWTLFAVQYTLTSIILHIHYEWYTLPLFTMTLFSLLCTIIALIGVIVCTCKGVFFIEPASRTNPVTLIFKVLNYARSHNKPVHRSAFTYGEEKFPSKLDLAKDRFGGPFTTEQVEDVKSFWEIIKLLLTLFGLFLSKDMFMALSKVWSDYSNLDTHTVVPSFPLMAASQTFLFAVIIIGIPVYMCLVRPCLCCILPSCMLKRIALGLFLLMISLALATASSALMYTDYTEQDTICFNFSDSFNMTDIDAGLTIGFIFLSQVFNGAGYTLVVLTALELIIAQGPRSMQSLLIGLWYAYESLGLVIRLTSGLTLRPLDCHYWPYILKTCFGGISLLLFLIAWYRYKYRERQEFANIHYHSIIEQYTSRHIGRELIESLQQEFIIKST